MMIKWWILFIPLALCLRAYSQTETPADTIQEEVILITQNERISYSLGITIGNSIKKQGLENIDLSIFFRAVSDAVQDNDLVITPTQAEKVLQRYFLEMKDQEYQDKIKEERAFLDENAQEENIQILPSGLQYEVLKEGSGPQPRITDQVTVHYHSTLLDGKVVESTIEQGAPTSLRVNETYKGLTEALINMRVGAKWRLFIPYDLAYGDTGNETVPPYSTIICVIELRSID